MTAAIEAAPTAAIPPMHAAQRKHEESAGSSRTTRLANATLAGAAGVSSARVTRAFHSAKSVRANPANRTPTARDETLSVGPQRVWAEGPLTLGC